MPVTIRHARFPEENSQVLALFAAYAESLGVDLTFQNFRKEVASFPGKYASSQGGALLLAEVTDTTSSNTNPNGLIGCVALRYNTPIWCEMKRLYVTPQARGTGTGEKLVTAIIQQAKDLGYEGMRLDTLPEMVAAQKLYRRFGFEIIDKYYDTPLEQTVFMGLRWSGC
ncbi:GNAT family N-acetyltransferase [Aspergillus ruber CBS 135680]|uniref:Acyl-CoA N-acyltransferase n=1 Tax=Aspergillus ruber (strain CBS 135680) TaxID=1388766 RepID=A0A017SCU1_ASPRC|nr:acyl-CoA N-acyltransferase [Aspergillus ruber CBS 135680]EYE94767.1 acyl-CoA N-acyltransferase [Aspergillus ruber CBS 135680]